MYFGFYLSKYLINNLLKENKDTLNSFFLNCDANYTKKYKLGSFFRTLFCNKLIEGVCSFPNKEVHILLMQCFLFLLT